ncbi:VOC family protein [Luteococcus peritonei]|uniref:VOC family protein n=1 Tax=Luteococcus peritonei TaxID=88874 RepID=A0ABW4RWF0_9ACTN
MDQRDHEQQPGTPTWADITSADPEAAASFLEQVLGWQVDDGNEELGGYRVAMSQQMAAGAIAPAMPAEGQQHEGDETIVYLATDDVEASCARIDELGGQVEFGPHDVAELGRMAVATDPLGNRFGLWQAGSLGGFSAVNDHGLPTWFEVRGKDLDRLGSFYGELFGLELEDREVSGQRYLLGEEVGITDAEPGWMAYYWVDDLDAAVETARGLGAELVAGPVDFQYGRFADLRTPGGAALGLFHPGERG